MVWRLLPRTPFFLFYFQTFGYQRLKEHCYEKEDGGEKRPFCVLEEDLKAELSVLLFFLCIFAGFSAVLVLCLFLCIWFCVLGLAKAFPICLCGVLVLVLFCRRVL
jgi:hypothetical protein